MTDKDKVRDALIEYSLACADQIETTEPPPFLNADQQDGFKIARVIFVDMLRRVAGDCEYEDLLKVPNND